MCSLVVYILHIGVGTPQIENGMVSLEMETATEDLEVSNIMKAPGKVKKIKTPDPYTETQG